MRYMIAPTKEIMVATLLVSLSLVSPLALAQQSQDPFQAAKDAYNKAKQELQSLRTQSKQSQATGSQPAAPPNQTAPPSRTAPQNASAPKSSGDCCSPAAMRKIADSLGFIDIVGIKLGMTPEQAIAAVKAFNPKLKIDTVYTRVEPGDAPGTTYRVRQFANAHSVGVLDPINGINFADGSADQILIEFTLPPSPPLTAKITREVTFPWEKPVVAANVLDALRKKYGQENTAKGLYGPVWLYDNSGKVLTRRLTPEEARCTQVFFPEQLPGVGPQAHDYYTDLTRTDDAATEYAACRPFTIVTTGDKSQGFGTAAPDMKMADFSVAILSPALLYASQHALHDLLKSQRDAKKKQQDEAAQKQAAPKL